MTIAVVGLGSIGRRHVRVLKQNFPDTKIVSIRTGKGGSVPEDALVDHQTSSLEEALNFSLDGAVIASPAPFHVQQASVLLKAGVPLLIEKPLAASLGDTEILQREGFCDTAVYQKSCVGYVLRFDPGYLRFKSLLQDSSFGTIRRARIEVMSYLPDWRPGQNYPDSVSAKKALGGGVLRELSHELDYAASLLGKLSPVIGIRNQTSHLNIDTEEQVEVLTRSEEGAPVSFYLDFASKVSRREFHIWSDKGELVWDIHNQVVRQKMVSGFSREDSFRNERDTTFTDQMKHFIDCLTGQAQPVCSIDHAIYIMKLIEGIEKSYTDKSFVEIL